MEQSKYTLCTGPRDCRSFTLIHNMGGDNGLRTATFMSAPDIIRDLVRMGLRQSISGLYCMKPGDFRSYTWDVLVFCNT